MRRLVILVGVVVLLGGCSGGSGHQSVAGTWRGSTGGQDPRLVLTLRIKQSELRPLTEQQQARVKQALEGQGVDRVEKALTEAAGKSATVETASAYQDALAALGRLQKGEGVQADLPLLRDGILTAARVSTDLSDAARDILNEIAGQLGQAAEQGDSSGPAPPGRALSGDYEAGLPRSNDTFRGVVSGTVDGSRVELSLGVPPSVADKRGFTEFQLSGRLDGPNKLPTMLKIVLAPGVAFPDAAYKVEVGKRRAYFDNPEYGVTLERVPSSAP